MGGLIVKTKVKSQSADEGQDKAAVKPAPRRKTRWWTYAVGLVCLALAWPLYQYNVSNSRKQQALAAMEEGNPEAAITLLEIEQQAHPTSPEIAYWMAVAQRRAGHVGVFQDHLKKAKDLGYPEEELQRQYILMRLQSGVVHAELEKAAEQLVENAERYSGPRVDLYIDEFYEARA